MNACTEVINNVFYTYEYRLNIDICIAQDRISMKQEIITVLIAEIPKIQQDFQTFPQNCIPLFT